MNPCEQTQRTEAYLDGALPAAEAGSFRDHLPGCAACSQEVALLRRVFALAAAAPMLDPPWTLTERILDRVLPSRSRRRVLVRRLGWAYAGALGASLATLGAWLLRPGTSGLLGALGATASHRLIQIVVFTLNSATAAVLTLMNAWGLLAMAGAKLAPLARALVTVLARTNVAVVVWPAGVACVLLLWWMRPRGSGQDGRMRHVGVLGF